MRLKKRLPDFRAISRRSIKGDFMPARDNLSGTRNRETDNLTLKPGTIRRVVSVGEDSSYYKLRSHMAGKLVRLVKQSSVGGWVCEFVREENRQAINRAAGWSDAKTQYLLDCVKFR